jgi:hypothetical protein
VKLERELFSWFGWRSSMVSGGWLVEEVELLVFGGSFASRGRRFGRWCRLMGPRCWCGDRGSDQDVRWQGEEVAALGESTSARSLGMVLGETVGSEAAECSSDGVVREAKFGGEVAYGAVGHGRPVFGDFVLGERFENCPRDWSDVASHPGR